MSLDKIGEGPSISKNEIWYVLDLGGKSHTLSHLTQENLPQAQECQSWLNIRGAQLQEFTPGSKVLTLHPTSNNKLLAKVWGHMAGWGSWLWGQVSGQRCTTNLLKPLERGGSCGSWDSCSRERRAGLRGAFKKLDSFHPAPLWNQSLAFPEIAVCHVARGIF